MATPGAAAVTVALPPPRQRQPPTRPSLRLTLGALLFLAGCCHGQQEDEEEGAWDDSLEVMAWCKGVNDGMDWAAVLKLAKFECFENEAGGPMRVKCSPAAVAHLTQAARSLVYEAAVRPFACSNGLVFVLSMALAYGGEALPPREAARTQVLLWDALQLNFMIDASVWPVKVFDVLQLFDHLPAALSFPPLKASGGLESLVTIVVPRCPVGMMPVLQERFPGFTVLAGVEANQDRPPTWTYWVGAFSKPSGMVLNQMLEQVQTPLTLVVVGTALPRGLDDLIRMVRVLSQRRVVTVGGPLVDNARVYSDFCHHLSMRHYRLRFDPSYQHSVIFDDESAASVRGSWFREDVAHKDGPCKLCDTLPPTFLGRTDAVYAIGFQPMLDGEWALLDFSVRAANLPLVEATGSAGPDPASMAAWGGLGHRHKPVSLALCPFISVREVAGLAGPHLYGRRDVPQSGVSPAEAWFGREPSPLGSTAPRVGPIVLRPSEQFATFMEMNSFREWIGPDGVTRHSGCTLSTVNCPVPDWVYRGWAVPPCCKETMRHLLFYIGSVFEELGIRYIITDGVLLGSYKFGGMLDWDADVDLHIHNDDFHRIETEVRPRVSSDGHFLRKHNNNNSWLLQANDKNYLLIELNKRVEFWDPERVWSLPVEGRLFPAMEEAHLNISSWYGLSFFRHRLRHVPEWEEAERPMYCSTPYHYNCVDVTQVPSGADCKSVGLC